MKYQTDYDGHLYKHGCLVCEIATQAELITKLELSDKHFLELVDYLHFEKKTSYNPHLPVLSAESDIKVPGSFVWDHETVFNEYFNMLGTNHRIVYTGCIYMPWELERGRKSFGVRGGDILILQIQTPNGGHFRSIDHDPWRPGTKMIDLKSIRYYSLV